MTIYASFNVGGTWTRFCIARDKVVLRQGFERTVLSGPETAIPSRISSIIDNTLRAEGRIEAEPVHLGLAFAGLIRKVDERLVAFASNMCGRGRTDAVLPNEWPFIPLSLDCFSAVTSVGVSNDVWLEARAQQILGALVGVDSAVYVNWGTGIGSAIILSGSILRGHSNRAGHGGHQIVTDDRSSMCGCGNFGDVESIAGGAAIHQHAGRTASELFELAQAGDAKSLGISVRVVEVLARSLFNIQVLLDPEVICIGGSVFSKNEAFIRELLAAKLREFSPMFVDAIQIRSASFDPRLSYLIGGVEFGRSDLIQEWLPQISHLPDERSTEA